jgi:hypothetical protein
LRRHTDSKVDRQLPQGDEIFLDHIAHFVSQAEPAIGALARVGFAPTPISVQLNPDPDGGAPRLTGTSNVTAMFACGYTEVLWVIPGGPLFAGQ